MGHPHSLLNEQLYETYKVLFLIYETPASTKPYRFLAGCLTLTAVSISVVPFIPSNKNHLITVQCLHVLMIIKPFIMSQAFVRESDEQWLHEVAPTLNALIVYLTRENNGIRVYEKRSFVNPKHGREVHEMSNGLSYAKDDEGKWFIVY